MQLEEAASRLQVLINFHKGLEKLHEVVEFACVTEQLNAERTKAAEAAKTELIDAQGRLNDFYRSSKKAMEETTLRLDELNRSYQLRSSELESAFAGKQATLLRQSQAAMEAHAAEMTRLATEEKDAQARVDELTKKLVTLEKAFTSLQNKAASLGA